jgi:hypothetical protein
LGTVYVGVCVGPGWIASGTVVAPNVYLGHLWSSKISGTIRQEKLQGGPVRGTVILQKLLTVCSRLGSPSRGPLVWLVTVQGFILSWGVGYVIQYVTAKPLPTSQGGVLGWGSLRMF